jgi:hypothetical protein
VRRRFILLLAMSVVVLLFGFAPMRAAGQTAGAYTPPRTSDGQPDLQGIWQVLNTAAWDIQDHHAQLGIPAGQGVVEGNEIPYLPAALKKKQENLANRDKLDPDNNCFLPGVPRLTYMPFPFQIVQSRDQITILHEYAHAIRYIYMTGEHLEGPIEWWLGDSRGRWDGNTLVVDTVHFNAETWFDRAGNHHSEELHVIERYTPTGPDHIRYEATIEDPRTFTRPWKMSMTLYRRKDPNMALLEYECFAYQLEIEAQQHP